jgi:ADP-dependent NAD(P)H-hydrate dehydratase / NAD(P)H-hydrate epimerase
MEAAAAAERPAHALMARAGLAVARLALALAPRARRVLVLAGPGNNGGDALVAAQWLRQHDLDVEVALLGDPARLPPDAAWAFAAGAAPRLGLPPRIDADLVIDGLLGIGLTRAPEGDLAEAIRMLQRAVVPVLAIDVPSGLDADRGTTFDGLAVRATHTLSLLSLKPGLFTALGRDHAGRVWFDNLGVPPADTACRLIGPPALQDAPHASHKGRFGDVLVFGGAPGMAGAAGLAAHAALAAGAGRVYLGSLAGDHDAGTLRPELMSRPVGSLMEVEMLRRATVVAGCGGGEAIRGLLPALLRHAARLVLDADALNAVAADSPLREALAARGRRGSPTALTPHPLEGGRLLAQDTAAVQADRPAAARALAAEFGAVVVLKGSGTCVASPDGNLAINATGNARLASAGTGDVLAGWLAGRWSHSGASAQTAAEAAVFDHGRAAEQASGQGPLLATDLIGALQRLG